MTVQGLVLVEGASINQQSHFFSPTSALQAVGGAVKNGVSYVGAGTVIPGRYEDASGFFVRGRIAVDTSTQTAYGTLRANVGSWSPFDDYWCVIPRTINPPIAMSKHRFKGVDPGFVAAHETTMTGHPAERPFDDPASRQNNEGGLGPFDDVEREAEEGRFVQQLTSIVGAVGEKMTDPGSLAVESIENDLRACLSAGRGLR